MGNNPINYVDPTGHAAEEATDQGVTDEDLKKFLLAEFDRQGDPLGNGTVCRAELTDPDKSWGDVHPTCKWIVFEPTGREALAAAGAELPYMVDGLYQGFKGLKAAGLIQPLGRGSTGRTSPQNLNEQIAMKSTMSDPASGQVLPIEMTDVRWPKSDGWVKMQKVHRLSDGSNITIHYVYNPSTGQVDDFKFK